MTRYEGVDIIKGVAVVFMIIFHIFYFPNQCGFKEIEYDTTLLKCIAKISQFIFITCVGINLVFSNQNKSSEETMKSNLIRIAKIMVLAILMSLFTYFVFGDKYVKFGILHFVALSSLLLFMFVNDKKIIILILGILCGLYVLNNSHPEYFKNVSDPIAFIMGFYNNKYKSIDYFPIIPWMILICIGILIGHFIIENDVKIHGEISKNPISKVLEKTGQYSLEIYVIHWLVLYAVFCQIYPKYIRKFP
jgi:uncharacterized membrane protein